jgi:hypothetical protein
VGGEFHSRTPRLLLVCPLRIFCFLYPCSSCANQMSPALLGKEGGFVCLRRCLRVLNSPRNEFISVQSKLILRLERKNVQSGELRGIVRASCQSVVSFRQSRNLSTREVLCLPVSFFCIQTLIVKSFLLTKRSHRVRKRHITLPDKLSEPPQTVQSKG